MAKRRREAGSVGAREIVLGAGFLGATAFIFGLGIWVGRELGERQPPVATQVVRADAPERPSDENMPRPVSRDFYNDHRMAIERGLAEEPSSAQTRVDEPEPMTSPSPPPATATRRQDVPPTATSTRRVASPTPRPVATPTARERIAPTVPPTVRTERGSWVVYVGETQDERTAFAWNGDLRQRGMTATTDQRRQGGVVLYRVRVGPFATRDEATSTAQQLIRSGKYPDAYAAPR